MTEGREATCDCGHPDAAHDPEWGCADCGCADGREVMAPGRETSPTDWCRCGSCTRCRAKKAGREATPETDPTVLYYLNSAEQDEDDDLRDEGREATAGPWCPVCRQSVPETGMAWTFPPHGDCEGAGRKVRDADHGFVTEDGRTVPEWEFGQ